MTELSDAIQDYLKEIYKLGVESERVSTSALAERQQQVLHGGVDARTHAP